MMAVLEHWVYRMRCVRRKRHRNVVIISLLSNFDLNHSGSQAQNWKRFDRRNVYSRQTAGIHTDVSLIFIDNVHRYNLPKCQSATYMKNQKIYFVPSLFIRMFHRSSRKFAYIRVSVVSNVYWSGCFWVTCLKNSCMWAVMVSE